MATRYYNDSTGTDLNVACVSQASKPSNPGLKDTLLDSSVGVCKPTPARVVQARGTVMAAKKFLLLVSVGCLLSPAVGCTTMSGFGSKMAHTEALGDFLVGYRNSAWAAKSWHCQKHRFCNRQFIGDFENGFRDGYQAVAAGGNGCMPAVCPQSYWGWQYQTADGQARMNAWFEGYPLGVQAAEQDGIGNWSQVRTSVAVPPQANLAPGANLTPGANVAGAATAAVPMSPSLTGPVTGGLSDQAEMVPMPMADPVAASPRVPAPTVTKPAPASAAAPKTTVKAKPVDKLDPAMSVPALDAAKAVVPPVAKPKVPVPQPNSDPFGFE